MNYWKNIGNNIRILRKSRGLTIEDLACVIGIAPGFLGLVERGTRGVSLSNLKKISDFFDVTLELLVKENVDTKLYSPDEDLLRKKLNDLAITLTDEELKVAISNMKRVLTLKNNTV